MQVNRTIAGWTMSPQLWEAWNFRAEANPPASTGAGQAPSAGQPQAGGTAPQAGGDESNTGAAGSLSLEEMKAELAKARKEAGGYRARLTTLEKTQQEADAAKLSDLEKAQKEAATLKETLAQRDHADLKREVAAEEGLPAAMAQRLQGATREELTVDAKALAKLIPAPTGQQSSGAPMNPASGRGNPALTLDDFKKMSPAQAAKRWPEYVRQSESR